MIEEITPTRALIERKDTPVPWHSAEIDFEDLSAELQILIKSVS